MSIRISAALASILIFGLFAPTALAFKAGDVILRAGPITVDPNGVGSDPLKINGVSLSGTKVESIDSDTQLGVTGVYMFKDYFGLELLVATPFNHTIKADGLQGLGIRKVGDVKQLPPTLSALFYPVGFSNPDSRFQPYVGLGINYTIFWDEDASSQLEDAFGEKFSMDVDNTWGIAGRAGFDYMITDNILFNASVWYINMETEAKFKGKSSGTRIKAKGVEIDPWVYTIGVGYRF